MFICLWTKKNLNRTLAIDSPFQTFKVGLLVEFMDELYHYFLQKRFPCWADSTFPFNAHHSLLSEDDVIMVSLLKDW